MINDLLGRGVEIIITDDKGHRISPFGMVPGYGGWGNNAPTKYVLVNGYRANFVSSINLTSVRFLTMEWAG